MIKIKLICLTFLLLFTSCYNGNKILHNRKNILLDTNGNIKYSTNKYLLKKNDLVNIYISTSHPNLLNIFSNFMVISSGVKGDNVRVDDNGYIELPRLGKIYVEGKDIEDVNSIIKNKFYSIFNVNNTFIEISLAGINYTIVSDLDQGVYLSDSRKLSIIDVISKHKINNKNSNLKNITIIRDREQGYKEFKVDVTNANIFNSDFFWIKNNDIIIINPNKSRTLGIDQSNSLSALRSVFGYVSVILSIILLVNKIKF